MEVATGTRGERSFAGARARRIVEAMRESVTEVGIAGSTFERVAAKAGVSRGLLHYYFGRKERLLVEVIRRDTDERISKLGAEMREAQSVDELIGAMSATFEHMISAQIGYVYMVSELYVAGRNSPELRRELGELYSRARAELAEILTEKQEEGVVSLRFDAQATLAYLFGAGDGITVQRLTDPTLELFSLMDTAQSVARWLLSAN
jgi:AcrR family transcriptional regulator